MSENFMNDSQGGNTVDGLDWFSSFFQNDYMENNYTEETTNIQSYPVSRQQSQQQYNNEPSLNRLQVQNDIFVIQEDSQENAINIASRNIISSLNTPKTTFNQKQQSINMEIPSQNDKNKAGYQSEEDMELRQDDLSWEEERKIQKGIQKLKVNSNEVDFKSCQITDQEKVFCCEDKFQYLDHQNKITSEVEGIKSESTQINKSNNLESYTKQKSINNSHQQNNCFVDQQENNKNVNMKISTSLKTQLNQNDESNKQENTLESSISIKKDKETEILEPASSSKLNQNNNKSIVQKQLFDQINIASIKQIYQEEPIKQILKEGQIKQIQIEGPIKQIQIEETKQVINNFKDCQSKKDLNYATPLKFNQLLDGMKLNLSSLNKSKQSVKVKEDSPKNNSFEKMVDLRRDNNNNNNNNNYYNKISQQLVFDIQKKFDQSKSKIRDDKMDEENKVSEKLQNKQQLMQKNKDNILLEDQKQAQSKVENFGDQMNIKTILSNKIQEPSIQINLSSTWKRQDQPREQFNSINQIEPSIQSKKNFNLVLPSFDFQFANKSSLEKRKPTESSDQKQGKSVLQNINLNLNIESRSSLSDQKSKLQNDLSPKIDEIRQTNFDQSLLKHKEQQHLVNNPPVINHLKNNNLWQTNFWENQLQSQNFSSKPQISSFKQNQKSILQYQEEFDKLNEKLDSVLYKSVEQKWEAQYLLEMKFTVKSKVQELLNTVKKLL